MEISNIIQFIAAFNFLLISGLIWYLKDRVSIPLKIFSFFLIGKGLTLLSNLIFIIDSFNSNQIFLNIADILYSFLFFYAPFLYFFAAAIVEKKITKKEKLLHFLPFAIFSALNVLMLLFKNQENIFNNLTAFSNNFSKLYYLQVVFYTSLAYFTISKNNAKESISSKSISKWLRRVLFFFLLVWVLFIGVYVSNHFFNSAQFAKYFKFLGVTSLLILSTIALLMSLKNPEVFFSNISLKLSKVDSINKYITQANYFNLITLMTEKELYKNPDLKVSDLSEITGLSTRNISTIIKEYNDSNFYDFINYYRIEEAKNLLESEDSDITILTILYESGFNSKSVFNTVFKKKVGTTPSNYRSKQQYLKYS